jgi:hypothetical protein
VAVSYILSPLHRYVLLNGRVAVDDESGRMWKCIHVVLLNMFVEGLRKTMKQYEWHYIKLFLNFSQPYIEF